MHDWLADWPALALACGLPLGRTGRPRIPSPSQLCKRGQAAGAPLQEALFIISVLTAMRHRLILNFEGEAEGITTDMVLEKVVAETPTTIEAELAAGRT